MVSEDRADEGVHLGPVPLELLKGRCGGRAAEKRKHRQGCACARDSVRPAARSDRTAQTQKGRALDQADLPFSGTNKKRKRGVGPLPASTAVPKRSAVSLGGQGQAPVLPPSGLSSAQKAATWRWLWRGPGVSRSVPPWEMTFRDSSCCGWVSLIILPTHGD